MPRKKLRILVFNWQDITNPLAGGAEVHLHEIFERIAAHGHEVTLFCHKHKGALSHEVRNGVKIIRKGGRFFFNFWVFLTYFTTFRRQHFDIIIDDINKIPFYTPLFIREPVQVITHHLFGRSIFLETIFPLALYVFLAEKLIKPVYLQKNFIFGSPSTHDEYLQWGFHREQLSIIPYCVNRSTYYAPTTTDFDSHRICYFGRLKRYKSVDHLLIAFAGLIRDFPDLKLDIIGDGDDLARLQELASSLQISDNVIFHGFVKEDRKAPMLHAMNFVVNTSSKEGWGLTVVEANACGIPVIAADVQGLRDSVRDGETGLLYSYGDISQLQEKMRLLLVNPELRSTLSQGALKWAAEFDWDVAAQQTLDRIIKTIDAHHDEMEAGSDRR